VALSVWRDEAKGIVNGVSPDDPIDITSDNDAEGEPVKEPSREPTRPPSSPSTRSSLPPDDDDFDIDEVIRQDEKRRARERQATQMASVPTSSSMGDPDDDFWAAMDESLAGPVPVSNSAPDEDEDIWDIVREMEQEELGKAKMTDVVGESPVEMRNTSPPAGYDGINGTNDEDMDDLYM
jgi:replication fork protection complex subunit Csm3/Swi3